MRTLLQISALVLAGVAITFGAAIAADRAEYVPSNGCETRSAALDAILADERYAPSREAINHVFLRTDQGIEVTLIFEDGRTINYSVLFDCTVKFA